MKFAFHRRLEAHSAALYALAPGRTPGTIFTGGADKVVAEWDLEGGSTNAFAIRTERTIYSLLNLNRSQLVIGTIVGGMHVIDLEERKEVRHLKYHDKGIFHMIRLPDRDRVAAACADGSVSIWNSSDWSLAYHLPLCEEKIRRLALHPSGKLMAVACGDGVLRLIETENYAVVDEFAAHQQGVNSVYFDSDGNLYSGGKDAHLQLRSAGDFSLAESVPAHNFTIYDIVGPLNGSFIATASRDKTVKIWDPNDMSQPQRLDRAKANGHLNSVNAAMWMEEEGLLATCSDDRTVVLWKPV